MSKFKIDSAAEERPARYGYSDILPHPYSNILIIARKRSGKSTLIRSMIQHVKKTEPKKNIKINIFSPTSLTDPQYQGIDAEHNDLEDIKDIIARNYQLAHKEPPRARKLKKITTAPTLGHVVENYQRKTIYGPPKTEILEEKKKGVMTFDIPTEEQDQTPPTDLQIYVFDDLAGDTRDKDITNFYKRNRHHKAITLTAIHNARDLYPSAYANMNLILLLRGLDKEAIEHLIEKTGLKIDIDEFYTLYTKLTEKPYSYMVLDVCGGVVKNSL